MGRVPLPTILLQNRGPAPYACRQGPRRCPLHSDGACSPNRSRSYIGSLLRQYSFSPFAHAAPVLY